MCERASANLSISQLLVLLINTLTLCFELCLIAGNAVCHHSPHPYQHCGKALPCHVSASGSLPGLRKGPQVISLRNEVGREQDTLIILTRNMLNIMANKCKLTPELIKIIGEYLRQGHFVRYIAERLGIGRTTLYRWIQQGEVAEDGIFRELWNTVQVCRAEGIMTLHNTIWQAAEGDPRLALEMLSRMQPEAYARKAALYDLEKQAAEEIVNGNK